MSTSTTSDAAKLSRTFEHSVCIRESHLDTFGHVNNAVYLQLFEEARWEIVTAGGYGLKRVHELQIGPTLLDVHMRFRHEIVNREVIKIQTWVASVDGKKMTFRQVMINNRGEEACVADFLIGLFDLKKRKLIEPTADWKRAIGLDS